MRVDLSRISTRTLEVLFRKLDSWNHRDKELSSKDLRSWGLDEDVDDVLNALRVEEAGSWHALIGVALSERRRPTPQIEVSWTGDTTSRQPRDTRLVVTQLFDDAKSRIVVTVFRYGDAELFRHLKAAATRGVGVDIYLDVPQESGTFVSKEAAYEQIDRFLAFWRELTPGKEVFCGRIFYDQRLHDGELFLSMHAKCVVVDNHLVYVGSANFTNRGNERNTEVGLLIDDTGTAQRLLEILQGGPFRQYTQD